MTLRDSQLITYARRALRLVPILLLGAVLQAQAQAIQGISNDQLPTSSGPVRLQQPISSKTTSNSERRDKDSRLGSDKRNGDWGADLNRQAYRPSEFELFVRQLAGITRPQGEKLDEEGTDTIRRFGAELVTGPANDTESGADASGLVPDDYVVGPGDEILLSLWGGVEANLRLEVDRAGRIAIPRVGAVSLAGVKYSDLRQTISRRVATQFKNFELSVALGQARAIRVYVTGHVQRPGSVTVSGLSTVLRALMAAGGPTAVGSFRSIQLRRGGQVISNFDLYDLMLRGDRSGDRALRGDDVIHVAAVGPQIGVIGSVNKPAVFELKGGETIADALGMAGGLSTVANRSAAVVHRLDERSGQALRDVDLSKDRGRPLDNGDVLRVMSVADMARPMLRQSKRVRVEGEVQRPGDYVLAAGSTLKDAIEAAGGLTAEAFLFGTEFSRESVRLAQISNYDRALRELESEFTRAAVTRKEKVTPMNDDASARNVTHIKLIERLRSVQPTGRVVLQMSASDSQLPALAIDDGDRILVPAKPSTVNVYGSVFNSGSYLFSQGRPLEQYLGMAGGATRSADKGSVFVVRANGSVVSNRSSRSAWAMGGGAVEALAAAPGDTIFVPEDMSYVNSTTELKDWAQILYQFGLGALALKNLK